MTNEISLVGRFCDSKSRYYKAKINANSVLASATNEILKINEIKQPRKE